MTPAERRILDEARRNGSTVGRSVGEAVEGILAGEEKKPARKKPAKAKRWSSAADVATGGEFRWKIVWDIPVRVVTEANRREHFAVAGKRKDQQREAVGIAWACSPVCPDIGDYGRLRVTFTHVGRKVDSDNLQSAFKVIRDALAAKVGRDDGDDDFWAWEYTQERGKPGIRITIEPRS